MKRASDTLVIAPESPCNLCGSEEATIVSERDRKGRPLRTLLCEGCGLVFSDPRPSPEELEHYYRGAYRAEYKGQRLPRAMQVYRNTLAARERMTRIGKHLGEGRLLDIGSGSGEFLHLVRQAGVEARGLEPDAGYSAYARERLDLEVETRTLGPPMPCGGPFQMITIFHVLEHLENPREAIAILASWLAPEGKLAVEVPNIESRRPAPHHRFHRAHLYHFNTENLAAMGEMSGLGVVETIPAADGGTITLVFVRDSQAARRALGANARRVRRALEAYTDLRHYLGGTLVTQQLRKLGRHLHGRWLCRGIREPEGVLLRLTS